MMRALTAILVILIGLGGGACAPASGPALAVVQTTLLHGSAAVAGQGSIGAGWNP